MAGRSEMLGKEVRARRMISFAFGRRPDAVFNQVSPAKSIIMKDVSACSLSRCYDGLVLSVHRLDYIGNGGVWRFVAAQIPTLPFPQ